MARNPLRKTLPQKSAVAFAARRHSATNITAEDAAIMARQHRPEVFLVCCIDSRFQPAKILDYGPGIALEHRPIACVIPPEDQASPDLLARMAFRRLNNVSTIALVCHSDCGGAQAALKVPHPDRQTGGDLHAVAAVVHQSGLDLDHLGRKFLAAEKGDLRRAGDRLAREVAVQSLRNLMGYKGRDGYATVRDEVDAGALNVTLLYYDLEKRGFQVYDAWRGKWRAPADAETLLMKSREPQSSCGPHTVCHGQ